MNFTRTVPKAGCINLEHLSHDEYWAIVEIFRWYASGHWSEAPNHSPQSLRMAKDVLAGLGEPLPPSYVT